MEAGEDDRTLGTRRMASVAQSTPEELTRAAYFSPEGIETRELVMVLADGSPRPTSPQVPAVTN
jgi:hypothetical protein